MIRWSYLVIAFDPVSKVTQVERFMFPNDANHRAEQRRRAGCRVEVQQRRMTGYGGTLATKPGFYE